MLVSPDIVYELTIDISLTLFSNILPILLLIFISALEGSFATTANLPSSVVGINPPPNVEAAKIEPIKSSIVKIAVIPLFLIAHLRIERYILFSFFINFPSEFISFFSFNILLESIGTKTKATINEANNE